MIILIIHSALLSLIYELGSLNSYDIFMKKWIALFHYVEVKQKEESGTDALTELLKNGYN